MRSSLRDIQQIDAYLHQQLSLEEMSRFRQQLLIDSQLYDQVQQQKRTYRLIQTRGRWKLRQELEKVHSDLFSDKANHSWQRKVLGFFARQ